jgi:methionyl-tRNA formyltransferase
MRVVFAGTPDFSVPSLSALLDTPAVEVVGVYTQPDRPAGRGKKLQTSPVKALASARGIAVYQPQSFREHETILQFAELEPELMVVVAYGLLLPQAVLEIPKSGCINVHASLLPRWRGAAPIQRCIEAGDSTTGVTLMKMQLALDSGPILAQSKTKIGEAESAGSLHDRLAVIGGELLAHSLPDLQNSLLEAVAQNPAQVTYASKLSKLESNIQWSQSALSLYRKIRAFNPWPVATTELGDIRLRVLKASVIDANKTARPGEVVEVNRNGIQVQTSVGILNLEVLQKPGGKALTVLDFLNGMPVSAGMVFGAK